MSTRSRFVDILKQTAAMMRLRIGCIGNRCFILCLEAVHVILLSLVSIGHFRAVPPALVSSSFQWNAWVISGGLCGLLGCCLLSRRSRIIASVGMVTLLGTDLVVLSSLVEQTRFLYSLTLLGTVLMSGGVVVGIWLKLRSAKETLFLERTDATALFFLCLVSPLLILGIWAVRSTLPQDWLSLPGRVFGVSYIEMSWGWSYPFTRWIFTALVTQLFWLPILARFKITGSRPNNASESSSASSAGRPRTLLHLLLLFLSIGVGVFVSAYPILVDYPLTGDANYYLSNLQQMDQFGANWALSTDRPLFFLLLHFLKTTLSMDNELFLRCVPIALTSISVSATYHFMNSFLRTQTIALLSAFLASSSTHVALGVHYFIIANWLAFTLMMILFAALLKSKDGLGGGTTLLATALSWLMMGTHFPTWGFTAVVLGAYTLMSLRPQGSTRHITDSHPLRVTLGYATAIIPVALLGLVSIEVSAVLDQALSKVANSFSHVTPNAIAILLRDQTILRSYRTAGCYATPITYALALFGLYKL